MPDQAELPFARMTFFGHDTRLHRECSSALEKLDNFVHASYRVVHRHLNDGVPSLDHQPRLFGSFIGRIRGLDLPIYLEEKLALLRSLPLS